MFRKVIHMPAECSPNVRLALAEIGHGVTSWEAWQQRLKEGLPCGVPSGRVLVPGVLPWDELCDREENWDDERKKIGLRALFPSGDKVYLIPEDWMLLAASLHEQATARRAKRIGRGMGVDPAQGGDRTAWAICDEIGLIALESRKTPDTNYTYGHTLELMRRWQVPADRIVFDRACGKEHADRMRANGWQVQTVDFGEAVLQDLKHGLTPLAARREHREQKSLFRNRRCQLYWELRQRFNPSGGGWGMPAGPEAEWKELRRQLKPIPIRYDGEGRFKMLPKHKKDRDSDEESLEELIGCSPDEADAACLALFGMTHKSLRASAGAGR